MGDQRNTATLRRKGSTPTMPHAQQDNAMGGSIQSHSVLQSNDGCFPCSDTVELSSLHVPKLHTRASSPTITVSTDLLSPGGGVLRAANRSTVIGMGGGDASSACCDVGMLKPQTDLITSDNEGVSRFTLAVDTPFDEMARYLQHLPLFCGLDASFFHEVATRMVIKTIDDGEFIGKKGMTLDRIYYLKRGSVALVSIDGKTVFTRLGTGTFLGEAGVLFSERLAASIRSTEPCEVWVLTKTDIDAVMRQFPDAYERFNKQRSSNALDDYTTKEIRRDYDTEFKLHPVWLTFEKDLEDKYFEIVYMRKTYRGRISFTLATMYILAMLLFPLLVEQPYTLSAGVGTIIYVIATIAMCGLSFFYSYRSKGVLRIVFATFLYTLGGMLVAIQQLNTDAWVLPPVLLGSLVFTALTLAPIGWASKVFVSVSIVCFYVTFLLTLHATELSRNQIYLVATDILFLVSLCGIGLLYSYQSEFCTRSAFVQEYCLLEYQKNIKQGMEKSDQLLHCLFPRSIAKSLSKVDDLDFEAIGRSISREIHNVTILAADLVGFTALCSKLTAEQVVGVLNDLFTRFDELASKYNLEKIKTVGDCYVVCAGVPDVHRDGVFKVVDFATDMIHAVEWVARDWVLPLQVRVGVHTGSVSAGAIGIYKVVYDVWGHDVDICFLMEQGGAPGRVLISEDTKRAMEVLPEHQHHSLYEYTLAHHVVFHKTRRQIDGFFLKRTNAIVVQERQCHSRTKQDSFYHPTTFKIPLTIRPEVDNSRNFRTTPSAGAICQTSGHSKDTEFNKEARSELCELVPAYQGNSSCTAQRRRYSGSGSGLYGFKSTSWLRPLWERKDTHKNELQSARGRDILDSSRDVVHVEGERVSLDIDDKTNTNAHSCSYAPSLYSQNYTEGKVNNNESMDLETIEGDVKCIKPTQNGSIDPSIMNNDNTKNILDRQDKSTSSVSSCKSKSWRTHTDTGTDVYPCPSTTTTKDAILESSNLQKNDISLTGTCASMKEVFVDIDAAEGRYSFPLWRPRFRQEHDRTLYEQSIRKSSLYKYRAAGFMLMGVSLTFSVYTTIAIQTMDGLWLYLAIMLPMQAGLLGLSFVRIITMHIPLSVLGLISLWIPTVVVLIEYIINVACPSNQADNQLVSQCTAFLTCCILQRTFDTAILLLLASYSVFPRLTIIEVAISSLLMLSARFALTYTFALGVDKRYYTTFLAGLYIFIGVLVAVTRSEEFLLRKYSRSQTAALNEQRVTKLEKRADNLLINVLPSAIAKQIKANPTTSIAETFSEASILFAEVLIQGKMDTSLLSNSRKQDKDSQDEDNSHVYLTPMEEARVLHEIFSKFDVVSGILGCEKIKTMGGVYMATAGVPLVRLDHADALANLALAMKKMIDKKKLQGHLCDIRVGLHAGPIVAGVIGSDKFCYDIWGDSVNVASRLESTAKFGTIQVSQTMQEILNDKFVTKERGVVPIKGKGDMKIFYLLSKKSSQMGPKNKSSTLKSKDDLKTTLDTEVNEKFHSSYIHNPLNDKLTNGNFKSSTFNIVPRDSFISPSARRGRTASITREPVQFDSIPKGTLRAVNLDALENITKDDCKQISSGHA
eukprot:CFRG1947T1